MKLYSDPQCPLCHRTRFVIEEKGIPVSIESTDTNPWPEEIANVIPNGKSPILHDRDLILYDSSIIISYLEERFAEPALMPNQPEARAKLRLALHRIDHDWYALWNDLVGSNNKRATRAKQTLTEDLIVLAPLFEQTQFFFNDHFSMADCYIAPLLWRLPMLSITLPSKAKAVNQYAERIFARPAFQASLTQLEQAMR
jgi:RNA polymerase-associated protein